MVFKSIHCGRCPCCRHSLGQTALPGCRYAHMVRLAHDAIQRHNIQPAMLYISLDQVRPCRMPSATSLSLSLGACHLCCSQAHHPQAVAILLL